ncbi:MAG: AAA family ATPase [Methylomarinum sp.]|nr:AAA family ATPase [Methylomarinum sp.]
MILKTKSKEPLKYQVGWLAALFAPNTNYQSILLADDRVVLSGHKDGLNKVPYLAIGVGVAIEQGAFWNVLVVHLENGNILRLGGISKKQIGLLQTRLNHSYRAYIRKFYQALTPNIQQAHQQAQLLFFNNDYIRHPIAQQWLNAHQHLADGLKRQDIDKYINAEVFQQLQIIQPIVTKGYDYIAEVNAAYVQQQLTDFQLFFDQVESNPLTDNQRKACVIDEQNNLVLAGAGTGKTSTMIGRAGYLVKAGKASPDKILMLAFARKAADEMEQRIQEKLGIDKLTVKTFHSLGKQIITQVEGTVPAINKMAEDEHLRARFVDEQIQRLLLDEQYKSRIVKYFLYFTYPYKSIFGFKSLGEYNEYLLENEIRTFQGELVKSFEECEIANFLFRQGISYEYEANYEVNTSGPDYRAYQPDFYLPDYGIYIEHFGVNENNQTPSFIDQDKYLEGMKWKRELHEKHQTKLIETYSYLKSQGILTQTLSEKLQQVGVTFKTLPNNELLDTLNQFGQVSKFSQLLSQLLGLFKAAYLNIKSLVSLAQQDEDHERMQAAAFLFEPIYEAYQQELKQTNTIDFDDMIGKAIEYVESGQYQSPYSYLLVDEFQDISASRARLIKGLLNQKSDNSLFCVGDDWQSVYRFTGSDVSITKDFSHYFGYTATSMLDKTFRFNNKIGDFASQFVMRNSTQIQKQINSHQQVEHTAVSLIKTNQDQIGLNAALSAINAKTKDKATVLILARFNFKKPELQGLKQQYPKLKCQFMTVHASKGKEADYVIVLGMEKGKHGFPSEKATHPLLELLLPKSEAFKHAEERRLFYVALTRAKHHVYLISDANKASPFIRELVKDKYEMLADEFIGESFQEKVADISCYHCKAGYMIARDSQHGSFFGCSQYPLCNHTQTACNWCGSGLKEKGRFRICENKRCDFVEPVCPKCKGTLSLRKGSYGQFWGCSHYRKGAEFSCGHTEKFIDLKEAKVKAYT